MPKSFLLKSNLDRDMEAEKLEHGSAFTVVTPKSKGK